MSHPLDDIQDPIDWDELAALDAAAELEDDRASDYHDEQRGDE